MKGINNISQFWRLMAEFSSTKPSKIWKLINLTMNLIRWSERKSVMTSKVSMATPYQYPIPHMKNSKTSTSLTWKNIIVISLRRIHPIQQESLYENPFTDMLIHTEALLPQGNYSLIVGLFDTNRYYRLKYCWTYDLSVFPIPTDFYDLWSNLQLQMAPINYIIIFY